MVRQEDVLGKVVKSASVQMLADMILILISQPCRGAREGSWLTNINQPIMDHNLAENGGTVAAGSSHSLLSMRISRQLEVTFPPGTFSLEQATPSLIGLTNIGSLSELVLASYGRS